MRLTKAEINNLKNTVKALDRSANIYLYGSRVDDEKQGGDIDILLISKKINRDGVRKIRLNFFAEFGEQKIDIVVDSGKLENPFVKKIFEKAELL